MRDLVNISSKDVEGKCDLKCAYNFNYTSSSGTAFNRDNAIVTSIEKTSISPVLYNKEKYYPSQLVIRYPSAVYYNDKFADAEILISHSPERGGKSLVILIPIKISSDSTSATTEITKLIKSVSVSAPSYGESVTISDLNLQNIVPKKPFYNFGIGSSAEYIAFSYLDAITISNSTIDTLKQILKLNTFTFSKMETNGLYYNSSGPNTTNASLGDGIYISCNPTGNSIETKEVTYEKNEMNYDMFDILEDPTFIVVVQIFIACFVILLICYIWNYGYNLIDGEFNSRKTNSVKG